MTNEIIRAVQTVINDASSLIDDHTITKGDIEEIREILYKDNRPDLVTRLNNFLEKYYEPFKKN